jgi:hypothetical protein
MPVNFASCYFPHCALSSNLYLFLMVLCDHTYAMLIHGMEGYLWMDL